MALLRRLFNKIYKFAYYIRFHCILYTFHRILFTFALHTIYVSSHTIYVCILNTFALHTIYVSNNCAGDDLYICVLCAHTFLGENT